MKWISVKDRVPGDEDNNCSHDVVLVYGKNDGQHSIALAQYYDTEWNIIGDIGATSCIGEWTFCPKSVTHWMYLPEGPDAK